MTATFFSCFRCPLPFAVLGVCVGFKETGWGSVGGLAEPIAGGNLRGSGSQRPIDGLGALACAEAGVDSGATRDVRVPWNGRGFIRQAKPPLGGLKLRSFVCACETRVSFSHVVLRTAPCTPAVPSPC